MAQLLFEGQLFDSKGHQAQLSLVRRFPMASEADTNRYINYQNYSITESIINQSIIQNDCSK